MVLTKVAVAEEPAHRASTKLTDSTSARPWLEHLVHQRRDQLVHHLGR